MAVSLFLLCIGCILRCVVMEEETGVGMEESGDAMEEAAFYNPCNGQQYYPDPLDCNSFYECDGRVPSHMNCGTGLEWSQELETCTRPTGKSCSQGSGYVTKVPTRPTPRPSTSPTTRRSRPTPSPSTRRPTPTPSTSRSTPRQRPTTTRAPLLPCGRHQQFYPDPLDCRKYYQCIGGFLHHQCCPPWLHWSEESNRCVKPWQANCAVSPSSTTRKTSRPTPSPTTTTNPSTHRSTLTSSQSTRPTPTHAPLLPCSGHQQFYPDLFDCSKYYQCIGGFLHHQSCPPWLHWSDESHRCLAPWLANCAVGPFSTTRKTSRPTPSPTTTTSPTTRHSTPTSSESTRPTPTHTPLLPCSGHQQFYPDLFDCSKYYQCIGGFLHHQSCPPGLHWSDESDRCLKPWLANCAVGPSPTSRPTPRPTPSPTSSSTATTSPSTHRPTSTHEPLVPCGRHQQFYPDPLDCSKYYQCIGGFLHHQSCPPWLHWSEESERCLIPWQANCAVGPYPVTRPTSRPSTPLSSPASNPSTPSTPTTRPGLCDGTRQFYPDPTDCSKYFQCHGHVVIHQTCPGGLLWDSRLETCNLASNVHCALTPTPTQSPLIPCHGPLQYYPDPTNCNKYYQCIGGFLHHQNCPPWLHWSEEFKRCLTPSQANCEGNPSPTTSTSIRPSSTSSQPSTSSIPSWCDGNQQFYPYPTDCGKYYECIGHRPQLKICPDGLHWSATLKLCTFPWLSSCSVSPAPVSTPIPTTSPSPTAKPQLPEEILEMIKEASKLTGIRRKHALKKIKHAIKKYKLSNFLRRVLHKVLALFHLDDILESD